MNVGRQQMDTQDIRVLHKQQQQRSQQHNQNTTTQHQVLKPYTRQNNELYSSILNNRLTQYCDILDINADEQVSVKTDPV